MGKKKKQNHTSKQVKPVPKKPQTSSAGYIISNVLWFLSILFLGLRQYREYIAVAILLIAAIHVLVIMRDTQMKAKIRMLASGITAMAANTFFLSGNTILFWITAAGAFGVGLYEEYRHMKELPDKDTDRYICIAKTILLIGGAAFLVYMELTVK